MSYERSLKSYWNNKALAFFRVQALAIAKALTDSKGLIQKDRLDAFSHEASKCEWVAVEDLIFFDQFISDRVAYLKRYLRLFSKLILKFNHGPQSSVSAEIIRCALFLDKGERIREVDVRHTVLSAFLMPLRQNVGSCFATAPAKLVQTALPEQMIIDFHDLLYKGHVPRNFSEGIYKAPLCFDWVSMNLSLPIKAGPFTKELTSLLRTLFSRAGLPFKRETSLDGSVESFIKKQRSGDNENYLLKVFDSVEQHPLLKVWEYTIATFSDFKIDLFQYNLYNSLGLSYDVKGGVGDFIYHKLTALFEGQKEKISLEEEEVVLADARINMTQALLKQADSSDKARRLQRELNAHLQHKFVLTDEMQKKIAFERKLSTLYVFLKDQYTILFKDYFQEIYSPSLYRPEGSLFVDAPAGFRLLYKGRHSEPHLWQIIEHSDQFIDSLKDFFFLTLPQIKSRYEWDDGEAIIDDVIGELSFYIESAQFIHFAKKRVEKEGDTHKTPWSYISGGSMPTLMQAYFSRNDTFTVEEKIVHSPLELLSFFIDTLKELPPVQISSFNTANEAPMLASSPTHAFSLVPGLEMFKDGWEDQGFTYTWIRDSLIAPAQTFYQSQVLSLKESLFLFHRLLEGAGLNKVDALPSFPSTTSLELWSTITLTFARDHQLVLITKPLIASFLRSSLPLFDVKKDSKALLDFGIKLSLGKASFLCSRDLFSILARSLTTFSKEQTDHLTRALIKANFLPPEGLVVGDTNWPLWCFSFLINPISNELEFWRTDKLGLFGFPMEGWESFMNESTEKAWRLYVDTRQYGFAGPSFGDRIKA